MKRISFLSLIILSSWLSCFPQADYWANLVYFSGCPVSHIPKGITLADKNANARLIINMIIAGANEEQIKLRLRDSAEFWLNRLAEGKVIERDDNHLTLKFPVIADDNRKKLTEMIRSGIINSKIDLSAILNPLKSELKDRPELVFHFLWSRVIDDCWWKLYESEFNSRQGPPEIAFIVYPVHPYQCGTNSDYSSDNSQFALSWSYSLFSDDFNMPRTIAFFNLAMKTDISDKDREFFVSHGLIGESGKPKIFCYPENGRLDRLCNSLKKDYVKLIKGLFDYGSLSKEFNIPPEEMFLIVSHEVAYEIFSILDGNKSAVSIPILKKNNPSLDFYPLVSWKLSRHAKK
ncbi:MAG TPA: hypothetical protein VMT63_07815 [Bacteroidales bacterium]|nr:hypothetical protein [Bacteroidales bacterium]